MATGRGPAGTPVELLPTRVNYVTATIANGASLSGAIDTRFGRLIRIIMPGSWTTANLTFQASYDGTNYANLYDQFGTEYTVTAAASRSILVAPVDFLGIPYLKVRSGTSGSAVNQGAQRDLILAVAAL